MDAENQNVNNNTSSDEIDLIEVIRYIWDGRWLIVKVTVIFVVLGLVIAFTSQEQFKAEARLLPEVRDTQAGGASALLRQFGGLGGFSLPGGAGADAIRPDLYPDVLKSTPFFVDLMRQTIKVRNDGNVEEIDVLTYLTELSGGFSVTGVIKKYTIGLPGTIIGWFRSDGKEDQSSSESPIFTDIRHLNRNEFEAVKDLRDRINANIDQRSGVISISVEFPDPLVSAQIADYAVKYLTDYITEYRVEKAQKDLTFIQGRYTEKEGEFHQAQLILAQFRDANRNIVTAGAQTEEQRLQDQYNLAFNVFNSLAQQLEQARIKVQEETPVIKVLEPVQVPIERYKPRRAIIILLSIFLGWFIGVTMLFGRIILEKAKPRFNDK
jgi:uncharacterized protein involved in exopolysaccharide biosynthesis